MTEKSELEAAPQPGGLHCGRRQEDYWHFSVMVMALAVLLDAGCRRQGESETDAHAAPHQHAPPHGGTGVVLGDEEYHLEFVRNAPAATLQAYVLSAHMENFVRITNESFVLKITLPDREETLVFKAVADRATGETAGDTAAFAAQADWLRTNAQFDAVLPEITIKGSKYQHVKFHFPEIPQ